VRQVCGIGRRAGVLLLALLPLFHVAALPVHEVLVHEPAGHTQEPHSQEPGLPLLLPLSCGTGEHAECSVCAVLRSGQPGARMASPAGDTSPTPSLPCFASRTCFASTGACASASPRAPPHNA